MIIRSWAGLLPHAPPSVSQHTHVRACVRAYVHMRTHRHAQIGQTSNCVHDRYYWLSQLQILVTDHVSVNQPLEPKTEVCLSTFSTFFRFCLSHSTQNANVLILPANRAEQAEPPSVAERAEPTPIRKTQAVTSAGLSASLVCYYN